MARRGMFNFKFSTSFHSKKLKEGTPNNYRNLRKRLRQGLELIRQTWEQQVYGADPLSGCRRIRNSQYRLSLIEGNPIRFPDGSPLAGMVISRYRYASDIEEGYSSFDMKPGLLSGPKTKINQDGEVYAIVPFRFLTPDNPGSTGAFSNLMDGGLYDVASEMANRLQTEARGEVRQEVGEARLEELDRAAGTAWAVPQTSHTGYEHLRPMAAGVRKEGAVDHHRYMSYRTVSENSDPDAWIHPGAPPNPIRAAVEQKTIPIVSELIRKGLQEDIDALFS